MNQEKTQAKKKMGGGKVQKKTRKTGYNEQRKKAGTSKGGQKNSLERKKKRDWGRATAIKQTRQGRKKVNLGGKGAKPAENITLKLHEKQRV